MTTTMTRESGDTELRALKRTNRILLTTAIALALLAIGFGTWAIYTATAEPENAASEEINVLIDDYTAAWNNYDGDAFLELVTDDYRLEADMGEVGPELQARRIDNLDDLDWQVEVIGERAMTGTGPWYVADVNRQVRSFETEDGFSIFTVVDEDGTLKVAEHIWIGD